MNEYAMLHIPDSRYCFATGEKELVLRLRMAKEDEKAKVFLIYAQKYDFTFCREKQPMEIKYSDKLYNYYEIKMRLTDVRFAYIFQIEEDGNTWYFSEDGVTKEYRFEEGFYNFFQMPYINKNDVMHTVDWMRSAVFYQIFVERFYKGNEKKDTSYINMKWDAYKTEVDGNTYYCGVPINVQTAMLYYRTDLLPGDWQTAWDKDGNQVPDMIENWNDMYAYSLQRHQEDASKYGYMKAIYDVYFSSGFLFSYGGYVFGDNNTNPEDIGFSKGESEKGAWVLSQLASAMNEECIDDTINTNAYSKLADGTYFATISTPDVYSTFLDELVMEYEKEGLSTEEAKTKAQENLVMTTVPKLPESGDLTEENPKLMDAKTMGGVNGYAVSAYTKAPNASLAFVEFAASYEMQVKRSEMLGVAPAREDAAEQVGGVSQLLYENLEKGTIVLMPSIQEVSQIWTPAQTFFTDIAKDAFRSESEKKYPDVTSMKVGLESVDKQIYDAIFTLK